MNTRLHNKVGAVAASAVIALTVGVGTGRAACKPNPGRTGTARPHVEHWNGISLGRLRPLVPPIPGQGR